MEAYDEIDDQSVEAVGYGRGTLDIAQFKYGSKDNTKPRIMKIKNPRGIERS